MCKNAHAPCPGCTRHRATDPALIFLTPQERQAIEAAAPSQIVPIVPHVAAPSA